MFVCDISNEEVKGNALGADCNSSGYRHCGVSLGRWVDEWKTEGRRNLGGSREV